MDFLSSSLRVKTSQTLSLLFLNDVNIIDSGLQHITLLSAFLTLIL